MIWGSNWVLFLEHVILNVFCEFWGFMRPLGCIRGVLRSTRGLSGPCLFKRHLQVAFKQMGRLRKQAFYQGQLALIKRRPLSAFYHRTPTEVGAQLGQSLVYAVLTSVYADCVPISSLTGREPV